MYKRNFHKGNYKDMRKYLAKLDWNNMLLNKTAIECCNILKYEIESTIDKFVPFQKQGKRCRKKHLSKEAIRKIMLKQTMWRVYRRTRKEEDYAKYKEALNAATTEIRQSKRSYEQKLACNIKNDSKSFYAYVRSKQNVQDKVGPLEDSAGNIISQGFLMAEYLNGYFSSVFTKEDISSLPVADAKFQGAKSDYLGPLVVTPELVVKKIKAMKDNKSPGVDGIPPKLLMETVYQTSIPLARVFNLSLKEGVVPFEWKEANIIPLFKKGSRNKSENYRPVSLTSSTTRQALTWNPQGKRRRGRPRNTWRRDLQADTRKMGYTWNQLERMAQDRGLWRSVVDGLCPKRGDGHKEFNVSDF